MGCFFRPETNRSGLTQGDQKQECIADNKFTAVRITNSLVIVYLYRITSASSYSSWCCCSKSKKHRNTRMHSNVNRNTTTVYIPCIYIWYYVWRSTKQKLFVLAHEWQSNNCVSESLFDPADRHRHRCPHPHPVLRPCHSLRARQILEPTHSYDAALIEPPNKFGQTKVQEHRIVNIQSGSKYTKNEPWNSWLAAFSATLAPK